MVSKFIHLTGIVDQNQDKDPEDFWKPENLYENAEKKNQPCAIRVDQIVAIESTDEGTYVMLKTGLEFLVAESLEYVESEIAKLF